MLNDVLIQSLEATKHTASSLLKSGESGVLLEKCKQQARV